MTRLNVTFACSVTVVLRSQRPLITRRHKICASHYKMAINLREWLGQMMCLTVMHRSLKLRNCTSLCLGKSFESADICGQLTQWSLWRISCDSCRGKRYSFICKKCFMCNCFATYNLVLQGMFGYLLNRRHLQCALCVDDYASFNGCQFVISSVHFIRRCSV